MIEHYGFIDLVKLYRRELGYAGMAATVCALRHIQKRDDWRNVVSSAVLCGALALCIDYLMSLIGISGTRAGLFFAFVIGYIGVDSILVIFHDKFPLLMGKGKDNTP